MLTSKPEGIDDRNIKPSITNDRQKLSENEIAELLILKKSLQNAMIEEQQNSGLSLVQDSDR